MAAQESSAEDATAGKAATTALLRNQKCHVLARPRPELLLVCVRRSRAGCVGSCCVGGLQARCAAPALGDLARLGLAPGSQEERDPGPVGRHDSVIWWIAESSDVL
jgi:hypothetical protein